MSRPPPPNDPRLPPPPVVGQTPGGWRGGRGRGSPGPQVPPTPPVGGILPPPPMIPPPGGAPPPMLPPGQAGFRGGGGMVQPPRFAGGRAGAGGRLPPLGRPPEIGGGRGPYLGGPGRGGPGGPGRGRAPFFHGPPRPPFPPGDPRGSGRTNNFRGMPPLHHPPPRFPNGPAAGRMGAPPPPTALPPPPTMNHPMIRRGGGGRDAGRGFSRPPFPGVPPPRLAFPPPPGGGGLPPPPILAANPNNPAAVPTPPQPLPNPLVGQQQPLFPHAAPVRNTMAFPSRPVHSSPPSTKPVVERPWAEYTDNASGKTYYSNGVTSQWTKPEEMEKQEQQQAEQDEQEPPKKKTKHSEQVPEFKTKQEALEAFTKLMAENDVTPAQKWGEVVNLFGSGKSATLWEGCQKSLTTGERKQALAEYQTKLANDLRTKERQGRQRSKEAYLQLLAEVLPTVSSQQKNHDSSLLQNSVSYQTIVGVLQKDDRFHAIEEDDMREALFVEFWEEYQKRQVRRKQTEKREEENRFLQMLQELADRGILTANYNHSWDSFVTSLGDSVRHEYSRFLLASSSSSSPALSDTTSPPTAPSANTGASPCLLEDHEKDFLFGRFLEDMYQAEEDDRRRSQQDRLQAEMDQREYYMETLVRLAKEGKIVPSSSFGSVVGSVLGQETAYVQLHRHDRDLPREVFEGFVNEWNEAYRGDRLFLSEIVRRAHEKVGRSIVQGENESYEAFCTALLDEASNTNDTYQRAQRIIALQSPVSSAQLYFNELQNNSRKSLQNQPQRGTEDDSSEDEGEIAEET